jgi:glycosyltransferase involved in cell wall biosynthesis
MKILITGTTGESMPPPYGGVPKLSLLCASEWKKLGHQVALTFVWRPENADELGAGAEYFFEFDSKPNKPKKIVYLLKYLASNPFLYFSLLFSYAKLLPKFSMETILYPAYGVQMEGVIKKFKPDVILSEAALVKTFMVSRVARRNKIPVIIDSYAEIHDLSMGVNKNLDEIERRNYWVEFLKNADFIIAPGPYCCRGPLTYAPKEKVDFVYDGSDYGVLKLDLSDDKGELRDLMKLPRDQFLIGNVGAFEARKGHDHLIKAVGMLKKQGANVGAVICGGSGDRTKWINLAKEEGVEDRIHFFGRLSELDLGRVLKSLDAFSDLENTPRACGLTMAILEGMALGNPVVIFANREMFEIVKEGENGFIVPIDDTEALSKAILKMSQLPVETRLKMGKTSSEWARKIDIEFTAKGKLEIFKKVINNYK